MGNMECLGFRVYRGYTGNMKGLYRDNGKQMQTIGIIGNIGVM